MNDVIVYNGSESGQLEVKVQPRSGMEIWLVNHFPDAERREYHECDMNYGKGCYYILPKTKDVIATLFTAGCLFSETAAIESLRLFVLDWKER